MEVIKYKNIYVFFKVVLAGAFLALFTACGFEVSEDVPTHKIRFHTHVVGNAETDVVTVTVNIRDGGGLFSDYVELSGSENIQAIFNGETKTLIYRSNFFESLVGKFKYRVRFNAGVSSGVDTASVVLNRKDGSSFLTDVTLPEQFSITSPVNDTVYFFGNNESISTSWDVGLTPDNFNLRYIYSCSQSNETTISYINQYAFFEPGVSELKVDDLMMFLSDDYTVNNTECNVTVSIRNQLYEQAVNPSFAGGSTKSTMINSRNVSVVPLN